MKEITSMTPAGIHYIDEEGAAHFVDFEVCWQNYVMHLRKSMGSRFTAADERFYKKHKSVGVRLALSTPPTIWFHTDPPTEFKFSTQESFWEVLACIKKAGYRTTDGE